MTFTGITATEAQIDQKTGANVSASYTDTMKTQALLMAESEINGIMRLNFSDDWAGQDVDVKYLVTKYTSASVAIEAIKYDMSGYTSRAEAKAMIDVLAWEMTRAIQFLKDKKTTTFITGET